MNNKEFNVIIPMSGEASRFGYKFKPFLQLDNRKFIEHVLDSFSCLAVKNYYFIITKEQQVNYQVGEGLKLLFPLVSDKIKVVVLESKTKGPYQTVSQALQKLQPLQNIIICDCDHYVNMVPILKKLKEPTKPDCILCLWSIDRDEQANWGKILLDKRTHEINKICEKEILSPTEDQKIYGIIGCHYFKSSTIIDNDSGLLHFTDFFKRKINEISIDFVFPTNAYFFGTPDMIPEAIATRRRWESVFCDVDGVLLLHKNKSNDCEVDNQIIGNCVNVLKYWRKLNKKIILTTARPERTRGSFSKLLKNKGIVYDYLVMGLNPGPRYIINDIKPSNPFVRQACSVNLQRNIGIDKVNLPESQNYNIQTLKTFNGNSFSKVYLLKNGNKRFVRKHIVKNIKTIDHYEKLKRQLEDLKRFSYYNKNLVPKIFNEHNDEYNYYFDMEYLDQYRQLDEYSEEDQFRVLQAVIDTLKQDIYCYKKTNKNSEFVKDFFDIKIFPKLNALETESVLMNRLINDEIVVLNDRKYYGLREIIKKLDIEKFNTKYMNPIHGDLTLQNILYNKDNKDFKLIDMDGSQYTDSCYFDLGKIFQSIVTNYKEWSVLQKVILNDDIDSLKSVDLYFRCDKEKYKTICEKYAQILDNTSWKDVFYKGIFYMSTYFIRFVSFRKQISEDHAVFAILMAINWLNYIYEEKNEY